MRNVDVIIFSTGRAASTAVYQYLSAACGLNLPDNKEPHFWCNIYKYAGLNRVLEEIYVSSSDEYDSIYSRSELVIDASVGYFFCIDEVIKRLKQRGQSPKVVFLYREPLSRAVSLFSEERKKGATVADDIMADINRERDSGLWWEHYYDNVFYADSFGKMKASFDNIIAVNYEYFARNQRLAIEEICGFLGLNPVNLDEMSLSPVNSSREADALTRLRRFRGFGRLLPPSAKSMVLSLAVSLGRRRAKHIPPGLDRYLVTSISQYRMFRESIAFEDLVCIKN